MKSFVRALLLAIVSTVAVAAGSSANVSWVLPVTYTDNSTLPVTDLASTTISWAPAAGQTGPTGSVTVPAPATSVVADVPCGSVTFTATVTTTATAKYPNTTSSPGNGVPYPTGITCRPNAVGGLTVN